MKIGWFSNWFTFDYLRDSGVPKNIREIPIINELLKRGKLVWLGTQRNPPGCSHKNVINFGGLFEGLPHYSKEKWGNTANYVHDIAQNYPKYAKRELPDVDCVFVRVLPSFIYENAKIYIMLYQYGLRGIPVFARDLELLMIKKFIVGDDFLCTDGKTIKGKPFGISGSDKAFNMDEWWMVMNKNLYILAPFSPQGRIWLQDRAKHLKLLTFHFPYDPKLYPTMNPGQMNRSITYIGNDTGRRHGFNKYFSGLPPDTVYVYGGQARQVDKTQKGFPETLRARLPNVVWHGPVPHYRVNVIYKHSFACMNIPRPYFNSVGFVSARFLEAVFSGALLLLPKEFLSAKFYTCDNRLVIEDSSQLKILVRTISKSEKLDILEKQRSRLKQICDVETNVDRVMETIR